MIKKIVIFILCLQLTNITAFAAEITSENHSKKTVLEHHTANTKQKSDFNFDLEKRTPVKIKISENITTKKNIKEGQELDFIVSEDVYENGKIFIPVNSIVKGKIETISMNQALGVPADIDIGNFIAKINGKDIVLDGKIHKVGANRAFWVYPIGCLAILFCFVGLVILPIRGGHAKIKTHQVYEVYYVPNL